jgi:hypothetical protein
MLIGLLDVQPLHSPSKVGSWSALPEGSHRYSQVWRCVMSFRQRSATGMCRRTRLCWLQITSLLWLFIAGCRGAGPLGILGKREDRNLEETILLAWKSWKPGESRSIDRGLHRERNNVTGSREFQVVCFSSISMDLSES